MMIGKLESNVTGKRSSRIGRNVQDMELADSLTRDKGQDQDDEDEEDQDSLRDSLDRIEKLIEKQDSFNRGQDRD